MLFGVLLLPFVALPAVVVAAQMKDPRTLRKKKPMTIDLVLVLTMYLNPLLLPVIEAAVSGVRLPVSRFAASIFHPTLLLLISLTLIEVG